jgi:hypothetical protein
MRVRRVATSSLGAVARGFDVGRSSTNGSRVWRILGIVTGVIACWWWLLLIIVIVTSVCAVASVMVMTVRRTVVLMMMTATTAVIGCW